MTEELISHINERFSNHSGFDGKDLFLVKMSLTASISSSIKHRSFYASRVSESDKKRLREQWSILLLKYSQNNYRDIRDYANSVFKLTNELAVAARGIATIKLAHAQKSLSLFLKYLWCYSLIDTPVACPIDSTILHVAKSPKNDPGRKIKIRNWTELDLNEKNQYLFILEGLDNWSGDVSIAEKELHRWNNTKNL